MAETIPSHEGGRKRADVSMDREDSERDQAPVDREVDWFFENASPNPDRIGCLPEQTLRALAARKRPISDPGYEHLAHCSPCYQHFRRLQSERSPAPKRRASNRIFTIAAGIVLILATAATFWWFVGRGTSPSTQGTTVAVLDLRGFLVTRGSESAMRAPIRLSRTNFRASILLPVGFETGQYDLRLVNSALVTVISTQAEATLENQVVTIHTPMKLSDLPAGQYQLALRRTGEDWQFFPTTLD